MLAEKNMLVGAWVTCRVSSSPFFFGFSFWVLVGGFFSRSSCLEIAFFIYSRGLYVSALFSFRRAVQVLHTTAYFLVFFATPIVTDSKEAVGNDMSPVG